MCGVVLKGYRKGVLTENIPEWFELLIAKMLSPEPSERHRISDVVFLLKNAQLCSESFEKFYAERVKSVD
jgi:hypothetical protein